MTRMSNPLLSVRAFSDRTPAPRNSDVGGASGPVPHAGSRLSRMRVFPDPDSLALVPTQLGWIHTKRIERAKQWPEVEQSHRTLGVPLPRAVRRDMEAAFRTDFSDVRLHRDSNASESGFPR